MDIIVEGSEASAYLRVSTQTEGIKPIEVSSREDTVCESLGV